MTIISRNFSGQVSSPVPGVVLSTVLVLSTLHMPNDAADDLAIWSFGEEPSLKLLWFYAFEEDPDCGMQTMPDWLLNICITARDKYNANWVLFDPAGDVLHDFPCFAASP